MDFLSLTSELQSYNDYIDNTNSTMKCISSFFQNFQQSLSDYAMKNEASVNELFSNLMKYDNRSSHIKKFFEFYRMFERHLLKLLNIAKKISKEMVEPTNDITKFLSEENKGQLLKLEKIILKTIDQKKKYEIAKHNYFDACKLAEKEEKILVNEMDKGEDKANMANVQKINDKLFELRVKSQNECQNYKREFKITNEMYEENNRQYFPLINNLRDNEEKRINFLSFHLIKFINLLKEEQYSFNEMIESISDEEDYNILDLKSKDLSINNYLKYNNISREDSNTSTRKGSLDNIVLNSNKLRPRAASASLGLDAFSLNQDYNNNKIKKPKSIKFNLEQDMKLYHENFNFIYKPGLRFIPEELMLYDIYRRKLEAILSNSKNIFKGDSSFGSVDTSYNPNVYNFDNEKIVLEQNDQIVFGSLFAKNPYNVNKKLFASFEKKLRTDADFSEMVIDKMLGEVFQGPVFFAFENLEQFERVGQCLIDINMNNGVQKDLFEMNFAIIYIAEKVYLKDKNKCYKKYLTKYLSDNYENFKSKVFWKKLLEFKIASVMKKLGDKAMKLFKKLDKRGSKTLRIKDSNGNITISEDIKNDNENKSQQTQIELDPVQKDKQIYSIIKDFLIHFTNFDLDLPTCNDIIMEVSQDHNLSRDQISYLVSFVNSNVYSIKNKITPFKNNYNTHNNKNQRSKNLLKKVSKTSNKKLKDLLIILNSSLSFLPIKDCIHLTEVSKLYKLHCKKYIYEHILLYRDISLPIDKHFKLWMLYLNYLNENKKKVSYKEVLEKIQKDSLENDPLIKSFLDTINMDVVRTFFDKDQDKKRIELKNILICLAATYPDVGYCQGMNYIVQFLLELTNNEELSFDIFSAIIRETPYGTLMIKDFEVMKKYFYIFERVISLLLPELYTAVRRYNVNASFYISPWFITLFTNSFDNGHSKIILRIIDLFILHGWSCILRSGLVLLKYYESDVIKMKFEDLLHFLINTLKEKYDFFYDSNFDKFNEMLEEMKVPKGLINNIEREYEIEKEVLKEQKRKEDIQKEKENKINV